MTSFIVAATAFSSATNARASDTDVDLHAGLERVAQKRIFFGHQSVGLNLLEGIEQLAKTTKSRVRIVETSTADSIKSPMIGHAFIAENGNPFKKLESFEQAMGQPFSRVDVAFMKFCYVDFNQETDVPKLFARYQSTFQTLKSRHPETTFVHVTVPLTVVSDGLKIRIKKLLGKAPPEFAENLRREEYNTLLRRAYQGKEPIFDLAHVESTAPNGEKVTVTWEGRTTPAMDPKYSNDGGHLNEAGQRQAAREFISILAAIPDRH